MIHNQFRIQNSEFRIRRLRAAFTLMELLMVLLIITILAGMALAAMAGATEMAKEQRTRSIISKLDQLVMPIAPGLFRSGFHPAWVRRWVIPRH
jgi:prepilin-type N-terminal cleavage/methylation domain-containing protein